MRRLRLVVRGRVQGVFFRASTRDQAVQLGLSGWVRNLRDGGVEVLAEGDEEALAALETWCGDGPPSARVDSVDAERSAASGELHDFRVGPTA